MKHSAYKSMSIAKERKSEGEIRDDRRLKRWIREKWRNLTPLTLNDHRFYECGEKSKDQLARGLPSVCRPTIKISKQTPKLAKSFSIKQIKKAVKLKQRGNRIYWNTLSR